MADGQAAAQGGFFDDPSKVNMLVQVLNALGQGLDPNNPLAPVGQMAANTSAAQAAERKNEEFFKKLQKMLMDPNDKSSLTFGKGGGLTINLAGPDPNGQSTGMPEGGSELNNLLLNRLFGAGSPEQEDRIAELRSMNLGQNGTPQATPPVDLSSGVVSQTRLPGAKEQNQQLLSLLGNLNAKEEPSPFR